jgi:hypothetical protein
MPAPKPNPADLELLTPEEREGYMENLEEAAAEIELDEEEEEVEAAAEPDKKPDKQPDKKPAKKPVEEAAAEDEPAEEDDAEADAEEDTAEDEAEDEEDAEEEIPGSPDEAEEADDAEDEEQPKSKTLPEWRVPSEIAARSAEIEKQLDNLAKKFDDGELTALEMREKMKPLEKEQRDIDRTVTLAQASERTIRNDWYKVTVPNFLREHTEYKPGSLRHQMLNGIVQEIQAANPNAPTDPAILEMAHERIVAEFGEPGGAAKPAKTKTKAAKNGNGEEREIPPSIAGLPAATDTEAGRVNEFANLDKLEGEQFERALARMQKTAPDKYERYLERG